ncbi:hypothetical protein SAMN04487887_11628 [Enterococcus casseliflavus]|uniref:DUF7006 family protein n=1 Tax=Enterococcus casseliflavus TaxID=37734 RepID=UPI0008E7A356|nr:hypothetical protein [Enterococcus casseliflavus]SFE55722.1 hypothetical protein SAMN04487887_11628 [Enterococcus casseliflavus]
MHIFTTREAYIKGFQKAIEKTNRETNTLEDYLANQIKRLDELLEQLSKETFWKLDPEIMGIDAKLSLFTELLKFEEFSNEEIIRMTEQDYLTYFKELCGYTIGEKTVHSMVFNLK